MSRKKQSTKFEYPVLTQYGKAIDHCVEQGHIDDAVKMAMNIGWVDKAEEILINAERYEEATEVRKEGELSDKVRESCEKAISTCLNAGKRTDAIKIAKKGRLYEWVFQIYEESGDSKQLIEGAKFAEEKGLEDYACKLYLKAINVTEKQERPEKALSTALTILKYDSIRPEEFLKPENVASKRRIYEKTLELAKQIEYWPVAGWTARALRDSKDIEYFRKAIEEYKKIERYDDAGFLASTAGMIEEAVENLLKTAHVDMAIRLLEKNEDSIPGAVGRAIGICEEYVKTNRADNAKIGLMGAVLTEKIGKAKKAKRLYRKVFDICKEGWAFGFPGHDYHIESLVVGGEIAERKLNSPEEARQCYLQAIKDDLEGEQDVWRALWLAEEKGLLEEVRPQFKKLLRKFEKEGFYKSSMELAEVLGYPKKVRLYRDILVSLGRYDDSRLLNCTHEQSMLKGWLIKYRLIPKDDEK